MVSRYRSKVTSPTDQQVIAVDGEVEQPGSVVVLLKYLLNPVKELSGEFRCLNMFYPCCSAGAPG